MAEVLLRKALADDQIEVESAGLGAPVGRPASEHSQTLMMELGENISSHRARQIHPDMVSDADLVLVMETGHKRAIVDADPTARGKVHRLGEWEDKDISDPYRLPLEAYIEALDDIQAGVASWVERIKA